MTDPDEAECFGGPFDGERQAVHAGATLVMVSRPGAPGVAEGRYVVVDNNSLRSFPCRVPTSRLRSQPSLRYVWMQLATALLVGVLARGASGQSLRLSAPTTTIPAYDTVPGIVATLLAAPGQPLPNKTRIVSWGSRPKGRVNIWWADALGQHVSIEGVSPGAVDIFASWVYLPGTTTNGKPTVLLLQDSLRLLVEPPRHLLVPFNVVVDGAPQFDPVRPFSCLWVWETDKQRIVTYSTGIGHGWSTNDTLLARTLNSSACPDTTVNPALLPP